MRRTMRVNCSDVFFRNRIHWSWRFALGGWCERLKPRGREHERRLRTMRLMILGGGSGSFAERKSYACMAHLDEFWIVGHVYGHIFRTRERRKGLFSHWILRLVCWVHRRKSKGRVGWEYLGWWLYHKTKYQWLHHECWEISFSSFGCSAVSIA